MKKAWRYIAMMLLTLCWESGGSRYLFAQDKSGESVLQQSSEATFPDTVSPALAERKFLPHPSQVLQEPSNPSSTRFDPEEVKRTQLLQEAARQGNEYAQSLLGKMYLQGQGVEKNTQEAFKLFGESAEKNYSDAQYNLGYMYFHGEGVPKDEFEAFKWLRKAEAQGNREAKSLLHAHYTSYHDVQGSRDEVSHWWERASVHKDAEAQHSLGMAYRQGTDVRKNDLEAAFWWDQAAEQGLRDAQYNLGCLYKRGEGVRKSDEKTLNLWQRAASQRHPHAQHNLGSLYYKGQGVQQDYAQARTWWERAAEQGIPEATYNLGCLYYRGQGVQQDYAQARTWWERAAEQGSSSAKAALDSLNKRREVKEDSFESSQSSVPKDSFESSQSSVPGVVASQRRQSDTEDNTDSDSDDEKGAKADAVAKFEKEWQRSTSPSRLNGISVDEGGNLFDWAVQRWEAGEDSDSDSNVDEREGARQEEAWEQEGKRSTSPTPRTQYTQYIDDTYVDAAKNVWDATKSVWEATKTSWAQTYDGWEKALDEKAWLTKPLSTSNGMIVVAPLRGASRIVQSLDLATGGNISTGLKAIDDVIHQGAETLGTQVRRVVRDATKNQLLGQFLGDATQLVVEILGPGKFLKFGKQAAHVAKVATRGQGRIATQSTRVSRQAHNLETGALATKVAPLVGETATESRKILEQLEALAGQTQTISREQRSWILGLKSSDLELIGLTKQELNRAKELTSVAHGRITLGNLGFDSYAASFDSIHGVDTLALRAREGIKEVWFVEHKFQKRGGAPKPGKLKKIVKKGKTTQLNHEQISPAYPVSRMSTKLKELKEYRPELYEKFSEILEKEPNTKVRFVANVKDSTGMNRWYADPRSMTVSEFKAMEKTIKAATAAGDAQSIAHLTKAKLEKLK